MAWNENVNLIFTALAALGALVTAYATIRTMLLQQRQAHASKPVLNICDVRKSDHPAYGHQITFQISDRDKIAWHVNAVKCRWLWHRLLCKPGREVQSELTGEILAYEATAWQRRISYDPPAHAGMILVRFDCPDVMDLIFDLAMKPSPNEKSRFPVRIRIRN